MTLSRSLVVLCVVSLCSAACSDSRPATPTAPAPIVIIQQPTTTTTTTPPPSTSTPTVVSYAGQWRGEYVIERCSGQGSLEDLFCSARSGGRPGGIYPVGTTLPISLDLSQSGTSVTGLLSLGSVRGPVTGIVRSNQLLTLQGTATGGSYTITISYWDTGLSNGLLDGYMNFDARYAGINGFAGVATRLSARR